MGGPRSSIDQYDWQPILPCVVRCLKYVKRVLKKLSPLMISMIGKPISAECGICCWYSSNLVCAFIDYKSFQFFPVNHNIELLKPSLLLLKQNTFSVISVLKQVRSHSVNVAVFFQPTWQQHEQLRQTVSPVE